MNQEQYRQKDLFTGELQDTRTAKQKQRAREQTGPRQTEMFPQRVLAQFGVKAHPKLPISPKTRLELMIEDRRSKEEKERDCQLEAEKRTARMPWLDADDPRPPVQD